MMDKDYLYQIDIREWIERGLDADIMVPVSGNKIDKKYDIYLQSFLLPLNEVENDMETKVIEEEIFTDYSDQDYDDEDYDDYEDYDPKYDEDIDYDEFDKYYDEK